MPQAAVSSAPIAPVLAIGMGLDEMRALLRAARPTSTAEALRLLRAACPHAPLRLRIEACQG